MAKVSVYVSFPSEETTTTTTTTTTNARDIYTYHSYKCIYKERSEKEAKLTVENEMELIKDKMRE